MTHLNGHGRRASGPRASRLLQHLHVFGRVMNNDRPPVEQRLVVTLGQEQLQVVREQIERAARSQLRGPSRVIETAGAATPGDRFYAPRSVSMLSRLRNWQQSLFFLALSCGAAVSIIGLIDLIWRFRAILGGLGAIAIVISVYLQTRHHRVEDNWIGS